MRQRNFLRLQGFIACLLLLAGGHTGRAQTPPPPSPARPTVVQVDNVAPGELVAPAAAESDLYCAGFIEYAPPQNSLSVVGGEQEQEQRTYSVGDYVFINAGAQQDMHVGNEYTVVRPRGQFASKWSRKRDWLGVYTQEVARLRVTNVLAQSSVAFVTRACDMILLGDLLRPVTQRSAPIVPVSPIFDRFAAPSGKQQGRIVLARDSREMPGIHDIVFIDLGNEDNVRAGDRLTIFRPAGTGNLTHFHDEEVTPGANYGFESERWRGGRFAIKAPRVKDPVHDGPQGPILTTPEVKRQRPPVPRKVVGEMVILSVEQRTATAVITRVAQEVHTGDYVEVQ